MYRPSSSARRMTDGSLWSASSRCGTFNASGDGPCERDLWRFTSSAPSSRSSTRNLVALRQRTSRFFGRAIVEVELARTTANIDAACATPGVARLMKSRLLTLAAPPGAPGFAQRDVICFVAKIAHLLPSWSRSRLATIRSGRRDSQPRVGTEPVGTPDICPH
jgi:hypothetical protein